MTMARVTYTDYRTPHWLVLGSLALNLFFIGLAGAFLVRPYFAKPAVTAPADRSAAARIDRLAATLPPEDAEKLRAKFRADAPVVEGALQAYRAAQDSIRRALRAEPFNVEAVRAAMADTRAARQTLDETLHGVIAAAAVEMSPAGRASLAEWPPIPRPDAGSNR